MRVKSILKTIEPSGLFTAIKPRPFPVKHLHAVHDADFVSYLKRACAEVPAGKSLYPYIFPIRDKTRPPKEPSVLSGYYCIDTFTPINANAYLAARRSVDCALTAALPATTPGAGPSADSAISITTPSPPSTCAPMARWPFWM